MYCITLAGANASGEAIRSSAAAALSTVDARVSRLGDMMLKGKMRGMASGKRRRTVRLSLAASIVVAQGFELSRNELENDIGLVMTKGETRVFVAELADSFEKARSAFTDQPDEQRIIFAAQRDRRWVIITALAMEEPEHVFNVFAGYPGLRASCGGVAQSEKAVQEVLSICATLRAER